MIARGLAANGASKIFVLGRREESLRETAAQAQAPGCPVIPVKCDITSKEALDAAYEAISAQTTHVDILFANSGVTGPYSRIPQPGPDGSIPPLAELRDSLYNVPMEEFTKVMDVNVTGAYYTVLAFLPLLEAANKRRPAPQTGVLTPPSAQVVITSSIVAFLRRPTFSFAYNASKAGTTHLVKMLSTTLSPWHIRVNGIVPGLYHTEMSDYAFERLQVQGSGISEGSFPSTLVPLTRSGSEQDFAGLVVWMASASGGYLNGAIMLTDGGWTGSVPSVY